MKLRAFSFSLLTAFFLLLFSWLGSNRVGYASDDVTPASTVIRVTATPSPSPFPTMTATPSPTRVPMLRVSGQSPRDRFFTELMPAVDLTFSRPVPADDLAYGILVEPDIPFTVTVDDRVATIQIDAPISNDTTYLFRLDARRLGSKGHTMANDYRWEVEASPLIENFIGISAKNPLGPLVFELNYPVNPDVFEDVLILAAPLDGQLIWNETEDRVEVHLDDELPEDTDYSLIVDATLSDQLGREHTVFERFTFTTPHAVAETWPPEGDDARNISVHTEIEISFNQPMDPATTVAAASISPPLPGEWVMEENLLRFVPALRFGSGDLYQVTLDDTALNADFDVVLREPYQFAFWTDYYFPEVNFGLGANAQVVDAGSRRVLHYGVFNNHRQPPATLTFDLYELEPADFVALYKESVPSNNWAFNQNTLVDYTQLDLVTTWALNEDDLERETSIPAEVPPGLYLVNLVIEGVEDQLFINLTNHQLVAKTGMDQLTGWVSRIDGGRLGDGQLLVYDETGALIAGGDFDREGLFKTRLGEDATPFLVMSQFGDDLTITGLDREWRLRSGHMDDGQIDAGNRKAEIYTITDRPIYKPGDTVNFKAQLRLQEDAIYSLPPAGSEVMVRVLDPRQNSLQTYSLTTDDFGTVHDLFYIEEGVTLGRFEIEVSFNGLTHALPFKVEDYRKPDIDVSLSTDREYYLPGDEIVLEVDANYFFGEPVVNTEISLLNFYKQQIGYWDRRSGRWQDGEPRWAENTNSQRLIGPMSGDTDENGQVRLTLTVPEGLAFKDQSGCYYCGGGRVRSLEWGIEATIDDGSNQPVSGFIPVTIYESLESVQLERFGYLQSPDEPFAISGKIEHVDGSTVAGRSATVTILRYSGSQNYVIESSQTVETNAGGTFRTDIFIPRTGFYEVRISSEDEGGRENSTSRYAYVLDQNFGDWWSRSDSEILITPNQPSYQPGETAQLVVESDISGPALLTVERGLVRREELVELTAPVTVLDLPIEETDAPNVHVSLAVWAANDSTITPDDYFSIPDRDVKIGYVSLSVPAEDKRLNVEIVPNKSEYSTREEASFTLRVTNFRGEPVSADLSFALVDEAIFALQEELSDPIHDSFYYERRSTINTYHAFEPARYLSRGGGGGGGGGGAAGGEPRADFPDTRIWLPNLRTDFNGEVVVNVTLPDTLTSWRATVKAATADTQVGEGIANVTTWQPFIIRPLLPRQLTAGDQVELSAIVHNYSEASATLTVDLVASGSGSLRLLDEAVQTITIPAGGSRIVGWPLESEEAGEVTLTISGRNEGIIVDAISLPLEIQPLAVRDVTAFTGQFQGTLARSISVPNDAHPNSMLQIELSRSVGGTLLDGLQDLTGYPYGCVEQTMSRALPNAVVGRALNQLGLIDPALEAELPALLRASVHRLYGFQHSDGGWGWWYHDNSDHYQTAWVIFGLAQMAEAGYEIEPIVIEEGASWLSGQMDQMDPRTRAFALYAIAVAGEPDEAETLTLFEEIDLLQGDVFSLAGLALALDQIDAQQEADVILDRLAEAAVIKEDGSVFWEGADSDGYYRKKTMASDLRSTALALSAFSQLRPTDPDNLQLGIVKWLMGERRSFGWGTTNETSFAILGLTDHLLALESSQAQPTGVQVFLNGEEIASGQLSSDQPALRISVPRDELASTNDIEIVQTGERPIYYAITNDLLLQREEIEASGRIEVERRYEDPSTNEPLDEIVAGQLVQVILTVDMPEEGTYMIIEDKLPGGFEALNEGLSTTSRVVDGYHEPVDGQSVYNYKEIRGDRVSFFTTEIDEGIYRIRYLVRATMSGEFVAMPAEAYAMYETSLWGRSDSDEIVISPSQ